MFIDGANLYKGITNQGGKAWDATHIDLQALCSQLIDTSSHRIIRIYYYDAVFKQEWDLARYQSQQQYFHRLQSQNNVELRTGRLEGYPSNLREKGVDVLLSVDLIRFGLSNSYDCALLITADGDYVPAIQLVKDMGKIVCNSYFQNRASFHIRKICDQFIPLELSSIQKYQLPKPKKTVAQPKK